MPRHLLMALLLGTSVLAQQGEPKPPAPPNPEALHQELVKAHNKLISEWQDEMQKAVAQAQQDGKPMRAISMTPPTGPLIARAQELAAAYAGTDDAVCFLSFICKNASNEKDVAKSALKTLVDHATSKSVYDVLPFMEIAAMQFDARNEAVALLGAVIDRNTDSACLAMALVVRGSLLLREATDDAQRAVAKKDLLRVAEVTKDAELLQLAKDVLFEVEHLQIGCKAPDIVAVDTDGAALKLSDYTGKVILLDFWGFW